MLYPLTKPQYLIHEMEQHIGGSIANIVGGMMCSGITAHHIEKVLKQMLKDHAGLRIRIVEKEYKPYQYIAEYSEDLAAEVIHFKSFETKGAMDEFFIKEAKVPFSLSSSLCEFYIVTIGKQVGCIAKLHHLISDAWTVMLIGNEILRYQQDDIYQMAKDNSYIIHIEEETKYVESEKYEKDRAYWLEQFAQYPEVVYLSDKPEQSYESDRLSFTVEQFLVEKMKDYCSKFGCSMYSLFMGAMGIYISRVKNKERFYLGTAILNRSGKRQKNTIGMFVNTAAVLMDIEPLNNFDEVIKNTGIKTIDVFRHQKYQYGEVLKDLRETYKFNEKLYDVMISYQNAKVSSSEALETAWYPCGMQCESLEIHINDREGKGEISIDYDYQICKFATEEIHQIHRHLFQVIEEGITKHSQIKDMKVLPEKEWEKVIYEINNTYADYPKHQTIVQLFKEQVLKTPENRALKYEDRTVTYKELDHLSDQFAQYLAQKGVKPGKIVGIYMPRTPELIIGILGVLKAGGAYLPIDCSYNKERVEYMLHDSCAEILITTKNLKETITFKGEVITEVYQKLISTDASKLQKPTPQDLIYIIYTSGSTGNPKGVMLTHQPVVNYITWAAKVYLKGEKHNFPLFTSISFDLTVTSLFVPILTGNCLVIYKDDLGAQAVLKVIEDNEVGVVKLTPTHLKLIMNGHHNASRVKRLIVGGEQLECFCAQKVTESFNGDIEIYNEYGPTEATVGCMIYKYDPKVDKGHAVPIGKGADNVKLYLLDKWLYPVAPFVKGEIYIGGEGVAKGYLGRSELTKERFIEDPFSGGMMYKTGDIAIRDETYTMIFCGRTDDQVKIRGHRIEIGEIEDKLIKFLNVERTVVRVIEEEHEKYLCAYYVAEKMIETEDFHKVLKSHLPDYMIPVCYEKVSHIPMTINGKVDVSKLPKPTFKRLQAEFVPPSTEIEEKIIEVFEEVLAIKPIGMKDSFLGLGGDSIKAIQIVSRLNDLKIKIDSKDILSEDTLERIIAATTEKEAETYSQGVAEGRVVETPILKWFEEQKFLNPNYYCQTITLKMSVDQDLDALNETFEQMIRHFDTLRVNKDQEGYYYNNRLLEQRFKVEVENLIGLSDLEQQSKFKNECIKLKKSISLDNAFPIKACLFKYEEYTILAITAHHVVMDGVTWRLLVEHLKKGRGTVFGNKTASYGEWGDYLKQYAKRKKVRSQMKFWNEMQEAREVFKGPLKVLKETEPQIELFKGTLDKTYTDKLLFESNKAYNTRIEELLVCGLLSAFREWCGASWYTIEMEGHGRGISDIDVSSTAGWFTAIYPVSLRIEGHNLEEQIIEVKEQLRQVLDGGIGYGVLRYLENALQPSKAPEIRFNYLGSVEYPGYITMDTGEEKDLLNESGLKLDINCMISNGKLTFWLEYNKAYFNQEEIEKFAQLFTSYIKGIADFTATKKESECTATDFAITQSDFEELFM